MRLKTVAVLVVALLCVACREKPIKIGLLCPLTGPYADLGVHGRNGARLAVEDINRNGGIGGRRITLIVYNDESTLDGAVRGYEALAREGVVTVVGPMTSEQSMAVVKDSSSVGIPLLSPTTSTPWLSGKKDLFFRIQPETDKAAVMLARVIAGRPEIERVCVADDVRNKAHTAPLKQAFVSEYTRLQGRVICDLTIDPLDDRFIESLSEKIGYHNPDALVIMASARHTGQMVRTLSQKYPSLRFFSCGWAQTEELIAQAGIAAERILLLADNMPVEATEPLRRFSWDYRSRYGIKPAFPAVRAHDAVKLLVKALRNCNDDLNNLKEELSRPRTFTALSGRIILDEYGDASGDFYLVTVRGGEFELINRIKMTRP
ncbi:ABC transporter substrate-binding protein [Thermodesulforhabdus norvegica]|uniref:Branched-chain amino acid transport system substrate-binding protein n=1 Tax=Thermodesulforhabdus norvegica TaxID=39841 RepID=A0A1I4U8X4_9BACT|nr:ABC transporter substrate-binding protein [Thermodesulforhabdus norvegica]SFM85280.1 branched-chain amino acid transport system substrate-binding protein [Thermodesulforhabdus norvegica]